MTNLLFNEIVHISLTKSNFHISRSTFFIGRLEEESEQNFTTMSKSIMTKDSLS